MGEGSPWGIGDPCGVAMARSTLILFGFLSLLPALHAQVPPSFEVAPQYSGMFPIAIADFNQNGHLEIANGESVLLGNGDGTFSLGTPLHVTLQPPYFIAAADFNGDGKADIAFLDTGAGSPKPILIFLGNGDGTFQPPTSLEPGSEFSNLLVADVNNDGKPDLLTLDGGALVVYLGKGDGTFNRQSPSFTEGLQYIGDFNGDGKIDVLWSQSGAVYVGLGNGDGTFKSPVTSSLTGSVTAVADFNNDGKLDLGVAIPTCGGAYCTYTFAVQLGNGDGTFRAPGAQIALPLSSVLPNNDPPSAGVGDFNGDGKPDVVYAFAGPLVGILLGNGNGTFTAGLTYNVGNASIQTEGLAIADLNGDHNLDIIAGQPAYGAGVLNVLLGRGDGTFVAAPAILVSPYASGGDAVAADFNGDEAPDVALLGNTSISILLNTGVGPTAVTYSYNLTSPLSGTGPYFMAAADLTLNRKQDLIVGGVNGAGLNVFLGNGDGSFASPLALPSCGSSTSFPRVLADFNGDNKPDLITTDGQSSLYICLGNGDGTFGTPTQYFAGNEPTLAVSGDFNGDGKLDIAVLDQTAIAILPGNGDGTFQPATFPILYSAPIYDLAAADVNLDGKLDLITGGQYVLQVYLGNGDGTFGALSPQNILNGTYENLSFSDFNGDGKPDLLVAGSGIFLGHGDGTFDTTVYSLPYGQVAVIADFGGHGKPDIAGATAGTLTMVLNTTVPGFVLSAAALSPSSVSPGKSATSTITVAAAEGFNGSVTLSCSSITLNGTGASTAPPACSFNPATIANGAGTSTLTVTTTGATALLTRPRVRRFDWSYATWLPIGGIALLGAGLVPTASSRRKLLALTLTCMALMGLLLAACGGGSRSGTGGGGGGGGGGSSGTPAGTYTITVSASATGLNTQTTTLTLTVD